MQATANLKQPHTHRPATVSVLYQGTVMRRQPLSPPWPRKLVDAVLLLIVAAIVGLMVLTAGCASAGPAGVITPQVSVFTIKAGYEGALTGMVAYAKLPRCTPANTPVCSSQPVLDQLERARATARSAIDAAEGAVRTPGFGADTMTTAVAAAEAATKALTTIANALPKPK